jgi:ABC-type transporter Mla subunit MlaD
MKPKPPKLYISSPNRRRKPPSKPASADSSKPDSAQLSGHIDQLRQLSNHVSSATSKIEQWLKVMNNISNAAKDRQALQDIVSALAQMQLGKQQGSDGNSNPSPRSGKDQDNSQNSPLKLPVSKDGDSLFDLINSPSFNNIVETVMKNRNKKQK